jgi:hypothetical protein
MRAFKSTETVELGGEEYTLAIDIEIIDALEDEFDVGFDQILQATVGKGRIGKTTRLLRGRLMEKIVPDQEAKDENPPKARRGTGASSSSRGARPTSRQSSSGSRHREPCS